jgi:hypothetical protein
MLNHVPVSLAVWKSFLKATPLFSRDAFGVRFDLFFNAGL